MSQLTEQMQVIKSKCSIKKWSTTKYNWPTFFSFGDHCMSSTESVWAKYGLWSTFQTPPSLSFHMWMCFLQSPDNIVPGEQNHTSIRGAFHKTCHQWQMTVSVISYWNPCFWLVINKCVTDFGHLSLKKGFVKQASGLQFKNITIQRSFITCVKLNVLGYLIGVYVNFVYLSCFFLHPLIFFHMPLYPNNNNFIQWPSRLPSGQSFIKLAINSDCHNAWINLLTYNCRSFCNSKYLTMENNSMSIHYAMPCQASIKNASKLSTATFAQELFMLCFGIMH